MKRLAITPGEPAGIGPELLVQLAQQTLPECELVAFADPALLVTTAQRLHLPLELATYAPGAPAPSGNSRLSIYPVPLAQTVVPGEPDAANAGYVLDTLRHAASHCLSQALDGLVTGPVHKGVINDAGIPFSGHTEFFAELARCDRVVMMLATEGLRVALATTHIPLRAVADAISSADLTRTLSILHQALQQQFGIAQPRILVCGLNPHAGEGGHLGREEIEVIQPVLEELRKLGMDLRGPLPADTLFTPHNLEHADAVLAMYHDQGLPVLKYRGFGNAVNITLGLPFVRTSVDHGTAFEIAGQGIASPDALQHAIEYAIKLI